MTNTTNGEGLAFMRMDVYRVTRELVVLVGRASVGDAELRDQATRAAKSALLNLAEGLPLSQGARQRHLTIARGSVNEVAAAVDAAEALGQLGPDETRAILALCDRLGAMLWRLTH